MKPQNKQDLFAKIRSMPNLPSPSESAVRIMRAAQDEKVSIQEFEKIVRIDPAFSARLLRIANSGRKQQGLRPVVSLKDALVTLGIPAVRGIALGFSFLNKYRSGQCQQFDYNRFWVHSIAVAVAFQAVCLKTKPAPKEEAFSIGLLANIGELALAVLYPDPFSKLMHEAKGDRLHALADRELAVLGFNHWELSAELLKSWGLPDFYTLPIALHQSQATDLGDIASRSYHLACSLAVAADIAELIAYPETRTPEKFSAFHRNGARASLEDVALIEVGQHAAEEWKEWVQLLGLTHTADPNFDWSQSLCCCASNSSTNPQPNDGQRVSVMIVDDEAAPRMYLQELLIGEGYRVITAETGEIALQLARKEMPGIVLTDWIMPQMDGLKLIDQIRKIPNTSQPYILVLTAQTEDDHLVEAFESGADDYLVKPIKPTVLLARLKAGERIFRLHQETLRLYQEMRDVANELSQSNRKLQKLATTDELTGCPNRRYAIDRLSQEWASSARHGMQLACMVIDIDWFKQINDSFGHERGDEVLKRIANTLRATLRVEDVVCRVGGDEFWVICPETDLITARLCAHRLRDAVSALGITVEDKRCTISVGIAQRTPSTKSPAELIDSADQALYQAKQAGKGTVC